MSKEKIDYFREKLMVTLKAERIKHGLSHEKISEKAGVTRQTIGKIEAGQINPTMLTMFKIVSAMDMTLSEFIEKMQQ